MTYTARSGSRVNDEEDDDTGLGEFRDGGTVFNSFVNEDCYETNILFPTKKYGILRPVFFFEGEEFFFEFMIIV